MTTDSSGLELSPAHQVVLRAVVAGAIRPVEIQVVSNRSHRRVADLLGELVQAGYLVELPTPRSYACSNRTIAGEIGSPSETTGPDGEGPGGMHPAGT